MKRISSVLFDATATTAFLLASSALAGSDWLSASEAELRPARDVIARFAGREVADAVRLVPCAPAPGGLAVYEIRDDGRTILGSSPVALCKGFYANAFTKGAGLFTWSGSRFDAARAFAPVAGSDRTKADRDTNGTGENSSETSITTTRVVSPFRLRQYFNVVTYGYSTAFWDEARWMRELDWMALHGVNAPLLTLGWEEISLRAWARCGMGRDECAPYFPSPCYLPWTQMGNVRGWPGSQTQAWRDRSVRLQHKVLARCRELGMEPIVPGFAGFVPDAFTNAHPRVTVLRQGWFGMESHHGLFLSPESPVFGEIGRAFVEEYEREFGKVPYFLCDSFNEMKLPWADEASTRAGLAQCGENIVKAVTSADPEASVMMQGWMFFYNPGIWTPSRFAAMVSRIPDDRICFLDMAVDFMRYGVKPGVTPIMNWERYRGFGGKRWIWGVLPNMGGRSDLTGPLPFYANAQLEALASPDRGALVGWGDAPEGIENNEVVHELAADGAWRQRWLDLREWLSAYTRCRWGDADPGAVADYWDALLSCRYTGFKGHDMFFWQFAKHVASPHIPRQPPSARERDALRRALAAIDSQKASCGDSPLWQSDRAELAAFLEGREADVALYAEHEAQAAGDAKKAAALRDEVRARLKRVEAQLQAHPILRLDRQLDFATKAAEGDEALARAYRADVKRLATCWGPPLDDYAGRAWAGLVGGYYLPRLEHYWKNRTGDYAADFEMLRAFALDFVGE